MKIASIDQEIIEGTDDMQLVGSGEEWEILWTHPKLTIEETKELVAQAIAPPPAKMR